MPRAMPPCGGAPNRSASSRKPNFSRASSSAMPSVAKTSAAPRVVEPDGAAADLEAVEHEVVAVALHPARIGLRERHVLVVRPGEGVVRGRPAPRLLVVLEERRVHDPEELPVPAVPTSGMRPIFFARWTRRLAITVCTSASRPNWKKMRSPGLRAAGLVDGRPQLGGDRLGQRRLRPLARLGDLGAREAPGADALGELLELVDSARERACAAGSTIALTMPPCVAPPPTAWARRRRPRALTSSVRLDVRQAEAQVRLVVAVPAHRLVEGQAAKGRR